MDWVVNWLRTDHFSCSQRHKSRSRRSWAPPSCWLLWLNIQRPSPKQFFELQRTHTGYLCDRLTTNQSHRVQQDHRAAGQPWISLRSTKVQDFLWSSALHQDLFPLFISCHWKIVPMLLEQTVVWSQHQLWSVSPTRHLPPQSHPAKEPSKDENQPPPCGICPHKCATPNKYTTPHHLICHLHTSVTPAPQRMAFGRHGRHLVALR